MEMSSHIHTQTMLPTYICYQLAHVTNLHMLSTCTCYQLTHVMNLHMLPTYTCYQLAHVTWYLTGWPNIILKNYHQICYYAFKHQITGVNRINVRTSNIILLYDGPAVYHSAQPPTRSLNMCKRELKLLRWISEAQETSFMMWYVSSMNNHELSVVRKLL